MERIPDSGRLAFNRSSTVSCRKPRSSSRAALLVTTTSTTPSRIRRAVLRRPISGPTIRVHSALRASAAERLTKPLRRINRVNAFLSDDGDDSVSSDMSEIFFSTQYIVSRSESPALPQSSTASSVTPLSPGKHRSHCKRASTGGEGRGEGEMKRLDCFLSTDQLKVNPPSSGLRPPSPPISGEKERALPPAAASDYRSCARGMITYVYESSTRNTAAVSESVSCRSTRASGPSTFRKSATYFGSNVIFTSS